MANLSPQIKALRILLAENDPDEMDRIARILQSAGYSVHQAYYVDDAVYAIEHEDFALAVIDGSMCDRNNRPLSDYVRQFAHVRWIVLVQPGDDVSPHSSLTQGASSVIQRPFSENTLLQHLSHVLSGSSYEASPDVDVDIVYATSESTGSEASKLLERRLMEQKTLSMLARSLNAELDLDTLLTQVVDAAVRLCNAEEGLLLLPDENDEAMYIRAGKGLDSETARNFRIRTQDTLAGQVYRTGKPILLGDQGLHKLKTEYLVRSLLYVPLSIKGQPIGVLGINNRHATRSFTEHDTELLQDLAAHAAIAIENARLYTERLLRTRELSTLVQAADATNSTLALDRVLSIIATQLIGALDVTQCYITEWHTDSNELHPLAIRYRALWSASDGPVWLANHNPALRHMMETRQIVIATPPDPDPTSIDSAWNPHQYYASNILYIPLYVDDQLLGVGTFYRLHSPYPDQAISQAAATVLHQQALQAVVLLVGSAPAQQRRNLFRLAQEMLDAAKANSCDIALWNAAQRQFDVMLSYGEVIWQGEIQPSIRLGEFPQVAELLKNPRAATELDIHQLKDLCDAGHGRSLLALPLTIKDETAGLVFLVDTLNDRVFTRREIELAQALVSQAANALDNARLYRDLALSLEELHRTQSKLVQTARLSAMGELAAAVAHQINNPLTTILGDAEMMLQDLTPDARDYEPLEAIFRAGKRAHEVVRRLLTMARQHSIDETPQPLDANDTIRNTLTLVKTHVQQGNVTLRVDLADELPYISGIQGQLEDVWLNLLLNARDAVTGRRDPTIGISTRYQGDDGLVEVVVWDNGAGVPENRYKRIFEPFYTTKPPGEGTGLGLHICKQIVEKCRGSISVESQYNQGTRFIIHLPVYNKRVSL